MSGRIWHWIRNLPHSRGRRTLLCLAMIMILGLGLRSYRVVDPLATPSADSHAYYALSKALYVEGSYGGPEFRDSSDWSPGAPLLYAAAFYATGGPGKAPPGSSRLCSVSRQSPPSFSSVSGSPDGGSDCSPHSGSPIYPPFIHTTGELMSEPPAMLTLPLAVLAFFWASDRRSLWSWLLPGFLFGLTALIRPDYLPVAIAFAALAAIRVGRRGSFGSGLTSASVYLLAFLIPVLPWTVRNLVVLERFVPISTGDGKALYVGTFLPAGGEYQQVKALLAKRYLHRELAPNSAALARVNPTPLFNRVADRYPQLPSDSALGKIAKQNFSKYFGENPSGYLAMTRARLGGSGAAAPESYGQHLGSTLQLLIVALALAGSELWPGRSAGGSWSRWRRQSSSLPRSAPSPWPPIAAARS